MGRQGLMDDSGYHGFDECANYESCTDNFVAELLEPYDAESIEELIANVRAKAFNEVLNVLDSSPYGDVRISRVKKFIAEQLKVGGENE